MDATQIQTILTKIEEINALDIEELLGQAYQGESDLTNLKINQLTVPAFVSLTKRVLQQLKSELLADSGFLLPLYINVGDEFGALNLQNDLTNFFNHVKLKQFTNSEGYLIKLAHYQVIQGFFDKSSRKIHDMRGLRLTEIENRLQVLTEHLSMNVELKDKLFEELEKKKTDLAEFEALKRKQLEQITQNLQTATQNSTQISELLNKSNSSNTRIETLLEQQMKNLDQAGKVIDEARGALKSYKTEQENLLDQTKTEIAHVVEKNEDFQKQLAYVEERKLIFDERNKYLDQLIGREVGASLFETFKQRKNELAKPVQFWKWAVLAMSLITVIGIYAIFTNIFGLFGNNTIDLSLQRLALNSLKTIPFFILLFFAIRQYVRERTYQEQYAFKSAVALTINAYSDLLSHEDNRDKLIFDAVSGIYHSPITVKDKTDSEEKDLLTILKNATETIKNFTKK